MARTEPAAVAMEHQTKKNDDTVTAQVNGLEPATSRNR